MASFPIIVISVTATTVAMLSDHAKMLFPCCITIAIFIFFLLVVNIYILKSAALIHFRQYECRFFFNKPIISPFPVALGKLFPKMVEYTPKSLITIEKFIFLFEMVTEVILHL